MATDLVAVDATPLASTERKTLASCEQVIERGRKSFVEVGNALAAIRDGRLYRETHKTFDAYCKERWNYKRTYVADLIGSAGVAGYLANVRHGEHLPINERQIRPLLALSERSEEDARERVIDTKAIEAVWEQVEEKAPKDEEGRPKITAKLVKEVVHDYITPDDEKDEKVVKPKNWKSLSISERAKLVESARKCKPKPFDWQDVGFDHRLKYVRAMLVVKSGKLNLIEALDACLWGDASINVAWRHLKESDEEISAAIEDARVKAAADEAQAVMKPENGKPVNTLLELLRCTWASWHGHLQSFRFRRNAIPGDRVEEIGRLCQDVRDSVNLYLDQIEDKLCLPRTAVRKIS